MSVDRKEFYRDVTAAGINALAEIPPSVAEELTSKLSVSGKLFVLEMANAIRTKEREC